MLQKKLYYYPQAIKSHGYPRKNFLETRYAFQKLQSTFLNQFSFHNFGKDNGGIHVTKKGSIINTVGSRNVYEKYDMKLRQKSLMQRKKESL